MNADYDEKLRYIIMCDTSNTHNMKCILYEI